MFEIPEDVFGLDMDPERRFQLGIQMEEARKRSVEMMVNLSEKISLAEHVNKEDIERWDAEFTRARSFMEYDEEGEQAEFLRYAGFDLDVYNRSCEDMQGVFDKSSGENEFPKEAVIKHLEDIRGLLGKRFTQGARVW